MSTAVLQTAVSMKTEAYVFRQACVRLIIEKASGVDSLSKKAMLTFHSSPGSMFKP